MTRGLSLSVRDLRVHSPNGRCLLDVPHLEMSAGSCLVVRGPSGAGKSTLLNALAGLQPVVSGSISWGVVSISVLVDRVRTAFRRDYIGFIFQDHLLFEELSAKENAAITAAYAPRAERAEIYAAADQMLMQLQVPQGTRTVASYSGGERQRVAVARALSGNPGIILADEPTASLDRETATALAHELLRIAREDGRTVVIVSHDPVLHELAPRLINMVDGKIVP